MGTPAPAARPDRPPRRLARADRHQQLVRAAITVAARSGFAQLSLEELAARAGVTRNLLYHYFPGGRSDIVAAVVRAAEQQLISDWASASADRLQDGLSRILDHGLAPTHAWRIHRLARTTGDPEIASITDELMVKLVSRLAAERGWGPFPLALTALHGYVAFLEAAVDEGRRASVPRAHLMELLWSTLLALPIASGAEPGG